jgi:hypothetical protein
MKGIIERVIEKRQIENNRDTTIRLSEVFMKKFIQAVNEEMKPSFADHPIVLPENTKEISFAVGKYIYAIECRSYKDEGNDPDVEEEICKLL